MGRWGTDHEADRMYAENNPSGSWWHSGAAFARVLAPIDAVMSENAADIAVPSGIPLHCRPRRSL